MENERGGVSYSANNPKKKKFYVQYRVRTGETLATCPQLAFIYLKITFYGSNNNFLRTITVPYSDSPTEIEFYDGEEKITLYKMVSEGCERVFDIVGCTCEDIVINKNGSSNEDDWTVIHYAEGTGYWTIKEDELCNNPYVWIGKFGEDYNMSGWPD